MLYVTQGTHNRSPACPTCQHCSSLISSNEPCRPELVTSSWSLVSQQAVCITGGAWHCVYVIVCRLLNRMYLQAQTVILINCGAQADLWNILQLQPGSGTRIIVADSHRCALLPKATHFYCVIPKPGLAA